jgi:hypothetical protein
MSIGSKEITLEILNKFIKIKANLEILEDKGLNKRSIEEYYSVNPYIQKNMYYLGGVELLSFNDVITEEIIKKVDNHIKNNYQNIANSWEMMSIENHKAIYYEFVAIVDFLQSNCITLPSFE